MRIIQLLEGDGLGGTDRVAVALGDGLRAAGHEVVFAVPPGFLKHQPTVTQNHACLPLARLGGARRAELREFNAFARDADLVVAHDSGSRQFALWSRVLGLRPRVWFLQHSLQGVAGMIGAQLHRVFIAHQVAVSAAVASRIVASGYPRSRVSRIHGGVDLRPHTHPDPLQVAALRQALLEGVPAGTQIVGMVARINSGKHFRPKRPDFKGYDVLFGALAGVRFPWRVLVMGPENRAAQDAVRQVAGHQGADPSRLVFAGAVPEPSAHFALMDMNVLPSRHEGLGLSVIESQAAGIPTVGCRSGGLAEVIEDGETGLLFLPGNVEALRGCLDRLVSDRGLRERLSLEARHRALEAFDAPIMVRAFQTLLRRVMPDRR